MELETGDMELETGTWVRDWDIELETGTRS